MDYRFKQVISIYTIRLPLPNQPCASRRISALSRQSFFMLILSFCIFFVSACDNRVNDVEQIVNKVGTLTWRQELPKPLKDDPAYRSFIESREELALPLREADEEWQGAGPPDEPVTGNNCLIWVSGTGWKDIPSDWWRCKKGKGGCLLNTFYGNTEEIPRFLAVVYLQTQGRSTYTFQRYAKKANPNPLDYRRVGGTTEEALPEYGAKVWLIDTKTLSVLGSRAFLYPGPPPIPTEPVVKFYDTPSSISKADISYRVLGFIEKWISTVRADRFTKSMYQSK